MDGVAGGGAQAQAAALAQVAQKHGRALAVEQVLQFAFARQWNLLRAAAAKNAIRILGDVAIFVNMDSSDVWVHPELFELDEELKPIRIAGVPPDYFSPTGQRWGNPLYRWDVLAAPASTGGSIAFAAPAPCTILSGWITSAASRPSGRFRRKRKRPSTASGSPRRASSSSARWKRRWDRCR